MCLLVFAGGAAPVVVDYPAQLPHPHPVLEGTGALVLDRIFRVAYVALSERADRALAEQWVRDMGYEQLVAFGSFDEAGCPVYHTNVMMAVGTDWAVVCLEAVRDG